eukprot:4294880-Pleurochrysis_carterae.AAC.1
MRRWRFRQQQRVRRRRHRSAERPALRERALAVPVLSATVAADRVLRRPFLAERVGLDMSLWIASLAVTLGILRVVAGGLFRDEGASRFGRGSRVVLACVELGEDIADCSERRSQTTGRRRECDLDVEERTDVLADPANDVRQLLGHHSLEDPLMRRQRTIETIIYV